MRSNLLANLNAVAAAFTGYWLKVFARPLDFCLYLLGLAARFAFAFPVCLWLFIFLDALQWCFRSGISRDLATKTFGCPVLAMFWATGSFLDFDADRGGAIPPPYALVALITLAIAVVWGVVCRRRCGPAKDWF